MIDIVDPKKPPKQNMVIVPPKSKLYLLTSCLLSSYNTVPIKEMIIASKGPALPDIAANIIELARAHLNA